MIYSFSPFGYEGALVQVEVDLRRGIPAVDIVGLADGAIKESRERMIAAIRNSHLEFPSERVLISLSPADIKKEGAGFDLAIACAVLEAQYGLEIKEPVLVMGELDLAGGVRNIRGCRAAVATADSYGIHYAILPKSDVDFRIPQGFKVRYVNNLTDAYFALCDIAKGDFTEFIEGPQSKEKFEIKFKDLKGSSLDDVKVPQGLKFAMTVAAAGRHHIMAWGSPGCGKAMALQHLPEITPLLLPEEKLSVERVYSLAGIDIKSDSFRPFRIPHQTASIEGICGGGPNCRPGEITLAHNGTLFLDEAAEFRTSVLQMLRCPLESGTITLSRAGRSTTFPANFQLVMAVEPCPCGNYGSHDKICLCSAKSIDQYWKKFSAPLLDRISIRFNCNEVIEDFADFTVEEARKRIKLAWERQYKRCGRMNQYLSPQEIEETVIISKDAQKRLDKEITRCGLSPRTISNIIKVAQTIKDMDLEERNVVSEKDIDLACKLHAATPLSE